MKKIIILVISILFLIFIYDYSDNSAKQVIGDANNNNYYEVIFENELLNFRNIKLKLAPLTSYQYNITKIYIKYPENIKQHFNKDYFSFDNSNFNIGINKIKEEYIKVLENNYLYDELDKDLNDVVIYKIEVYAENAAIEKLKLKNPNIIVKRGYSY